jgi:hypothetical protein
MNGRGGAQGRAEAAPRGRPKVALRATLRPLRPLYGRAGGHRAGFGGRAGRVWTAPGRATGPVHFGDRRLIRSERWIGSE